MRLLLVLAAAVGPLACAIPSSETTVSAQSPNPAAVSVALVIDSSSSMADNDPANRRLDAARAYLSASLPDDVVSIIDFDDSARIVAEPAPVGPNRQIFSDAIAAINADGDTNLSAGLGSALAVLGRSATARRAAIFMTDGQGDYAGEATTFASQGWPIFVIGLGLDVDYATLSGIATASGGQYLQLAGATNLVCDFQRIRALIAGVDTPPCKPAGTITQGQTLSFPQQVAAGLAQVTFSSSWQSGDIDLKATSPSGRVIDSRSIDADVVVSVGPAHKSITVAAPEPGVWSLDVFGLVVAAVGEPFALSAIQIPAAAPGPVATAAPITPVWPYGDFRNVPQLGAEVVRGTGCGGDYTGQIGDVIPDGIWSGFVESYDPVARGIQFDLVCISFGQRAQDLLAAGTANVISYDPEYMIVNNAERLRFVPDGITVLVLGQPTAGGGCVEGPHLAADQLPSAIAANSARQAWINIVGGRAAYVFWGCTTP